MPDLRPFRALRYEPSRVGDLAAVVAPPYDVIDPVTRARLVARHPANVVRLELPIEEPGDGSDDRYRRAAKTLATWRSDGTLRKDPQPSIYVYEQRYRVPDTDSERVQRGFFARLRLEAFGPGAGVLPHERTLSGPKEDRYKLLRATGVNTSPVVALFDDPSGSTDERLGAVVGGPPDVDLTADGVCHRMWALPASGDGPASTVAGALLEAASAGPVTIADGHHRYETALRYRDERRMTRSCDEDPAFDYVLVLMLEASRQALTVLPTHRLIRGIGPEGVAALVAQAPALFEFVAVTASDTLCAEMVTEREATGGRGRFGLWTRDGGALLTARRDAFEPLLTSGGEAVRSLDVTLLAVALERLAGIDAGAIADGAIDYTKSAAEAIAAVDAGSDVDVAFLLEPTPVAAVESVAREGDVMPQKSTYFYPKALTGLVINPHEW